jgi:copper(I)-binding protein
MKSHETVRRVLLLGLAVSAVFAAGAHAQNQPAIMIDQPWSRATAGTAKTGAGYMTIANTGALPDRLVQASSPASTVVELHEMAMVGNVMQMRPLADGIPVPAAGSVALQPGGLHLMFIDLKAPLRAGTKVPVTLRFERGGEMQIELEVRDMRGTPPQGHRAPH